jgi:SAM-dependent methyltransferase
MKWDPVLRLVGRTWKPIPEVLESLRDAPLSPDGYQNFVFQWDADFFRDRVKMVGFTGADLVLDAGTGLGQWAAALGSLNRRVIAVDRHPSMVETAKILCEKWDAPNVDVRQGQLPDLDFADESFDLIWCSLVLEYVDRDRVVAAFHRWLKPGGRLYVTTNARGRWLFKFLKHSFELNRRAARVAWRTFRRGDRIGSVPNYTNTGDVAALCRRHGFEPVGAGPDGMLDLTASNGATRRRPMFARRFMLFFENNVEFVVRKP